MGLTENAVCMLPTTTTATTDPHPVLKDFEMAEIAAAFHNETPTEDAASVLPFGRRCQVLIDNHMFHFHFEVLESIMMQFPLPPLASCPEGRMEFTFFLASSTSGTTFQKNRVIDWQRYALSSIVNSTTNSTTQHTGQTALRSLKAVVQNDKDGIDVVQNTVFEYQIRATCYCQRQEIDWLKNISSSDSVAGSKRYCVFHEDCGQFHKSEHALWVSPHYPRYLLPTHLPTFSHKRAVNQSAMNFCVMGSPLKRNYPMLANYLNQTQQLQDDGLKDNIHIYQLGQGGIPKAMEPHQHFFSAHMEPSFVSYQRMVYDKCDVVLALITKSIAPFYFPGSAKKKLSGSIPQAIAYGRGIVIHKDLALLYKKHLEEIPVETHDDSPASFAKAMDRMIVRQQQLKGLPAVALGASNSRNETVQVTVSQARNGTSQLQG